MWVANNEIDRYIVNRTFFVIRKTQFELQTFELGNYRAQPYFIRNSPIGPIYQSESRDPVFQTLRQNTGYCFRATKSIYVYFIYGLQPQGPSMYTLSMV